MSSGNLDTNQNRDLFIWKPELDPEEYTGVTYLVRSQRGAEETAVAVAMEQSAACVQISGFVAPSALELWTARVVHVSALDGANESPIGAFELPTEVYRTDSVNRNSRSIIKIAYPNRNLLAKPNQWMNVLIGEIPRLGFISELCVVDVHFTGSRLSGPRFGVAGIRRLLSNVKTPLLCRSMRPAIGLGQSTMAQLNEVVLKNGFHMVKDDELILFPTNAVFRSHVAAMVEARNRAEDASGERKMYIANLICEAEELFERIDIVVQEGADAVLVAPAVQGLGILQTVSSVGTIPVLAHNTVSEMYTRCPFWCINHAAFAKLQRAFGADWIVSQGPFATETVETEEQFGFIDACRGQWCGLPAAMPILQGGKMPMGLGAYIGAAQGMDFMLIVASWIDSHPEGIGAGATVFRKAIDTFEDHAGAYTTDGINKRTRIGPVQ